MQISKNPKEQISTQKALVFLIPLGILMTVIIVFIFVVPTSYAQIIDRIQSYKSDQQIEDILTKKLAALESTSPDTLNKASQTVIVLPDKNPVLPLISQIKELAISENVAVTDLRTDSVSELEGGIHKSEIKVSLEAEDFTSIANLVYELSKRAPVSTVELTEILDETTVKQANLRISAYWAELPTTLPAETDPLTPFSPEELALLDQLSRLTPPQFNELVPGSQSPRENPFN